MAITVPVIGQSNWGTPLNAALLDLDGRLEDIALAVTDYGAVGDGVTDDSAAIQAALDAAPLGGVVYLAPLEFGLLNSIRVPPYVTLRGPHADRDGAGDGSACLLPLAGFTDAMVIEMVDQATGGYAVTNRDIVLDNITVDGRLLTTETVVGIRATGFVHGVQMRNVSVHKVSSHSVELVANGSGTPYSWLMQNVQIVGADTAATTWNGFQMLGTDHQFIACRTLGVRGHGYRLSAGPNTQLIGCRAEWSAMSGFYLTGNWGTVQGAGGALLAGCSTDRNNQYGILIDSTGSAPHTISGGMLRRDGRNGFPGAGGGGFAALRVSSATTPVIVTGLHTYPGVGDDGLGVNSPERGLSAAASTYVSVSGSYLHADTTPFHDGTGNTQLLRGPAVGTATGTTAAPVRSVTEQVSIPGPVTITQGGYQASRGAAGNTVLDGLVTGDTVSRYNVTAAGTTSWGPGGAGALDVVMSRSAANALALTTADFRIATAGRGLRVAEGANAKMGVATLAGGTILVANTSITANSRIFISRVSGAAANFGTLTYTISAGASFTINSSNVSDTSVVNWLIMEPA